MDGSSSQTPSTIKELKDTLWKAANKLRGSLSAGQYKDVVLGLVFLKYVSDAYGERSDGEFAVPPAARWNFLADSVETNIGQLADEAMDALMTANPPLAGMLPRLYNNVDKRRLGELVDLLDHARFSRQGTNRARDLMGEVYEYFLGNFARAEGRRGGEFFTPPSVVRVIVEVLEPSRGRVYDPCCGSGGMFVQTENFIVERDSDPTGVSICGTRVRALCSQAATAIACQCTSLRCACVPSSLTTLRSVSTGISLATPSSVAFCTTRSMRSPREMPWARVIASGDSRSVRCCSPTTTVTASSCTA